MKRRKEISAIFRQAWQRFKQNFYMWPAVQKRFNLFKPLLYFSFSFFLFMRPFPLFCSVFDSTPKSQKAHLKANSVLKHNYKGTVHWIKKNYYWVKNWIFYKNIIWPTVFGVRKWERDWYYNTSVKLMQDWWSVGFFILLNRLAIYLFSNFMGS